MLNIIVVDDEAPIREWIVYSIRKQGKLFNVVGAANSGEEAFEMIMKYKPDVVLTDIRMPGMDGLELMKAVKIVLPYTAFIVLTNYADFTYAKQSITYGAREYLLKSEMRGEDITQALQKVLGEKREIVHQKKKDILANGHIDLYGLYQGLGEKGHSKRFWSQYYMKDEKPYCILTLKEEGEYSEREFLIEELKRVRPNFFITAIRHGIIYIIIQEESEESLEEKTCEVVKYIINQKTGILAKGKIYTYLEESITALDQAAVVLGYTFFDQGQRILDYLSLCRSKRLDRGEIRDKYHDILNDLSLKLYDKSKIKLKNWFESLESVHIKDALWAKEMCQRMVISVEERFYQLDIMLEEGSFKEISSSLEQCHKQCEKMIGQMITEESQTHQKPIEIALQYIQQRYDQNISLAEVAQVVYLSSEYFSRLFKEEVGENFSVYLMMYRLERAREYLIHTDLRIAEIAHKVGYGTPGYFSRIYKKYMGKSPDEERNKK